MSDNNIDLRSQREPFEEDPIEAGTVLALAGLVSFELVKKVGGKIKDRVMAVVGKFRDDPMWTE